MKKSPLEMCEWCYDPMEQQTNEQTNATNNKPQNNQTNTTNKQCNYFHMTERTHIPRRPLLLALEVLLA